MHYAQTYDSIISKRSSTMRFQKTDPKCTIPTSRAECHSIRADAQAAHSVFMASQNTNAFAPQCVPYVARPIVVATEKYTARDGKGNGSNTAENVIMRKSVQFTVSSNVK
jgi:hypothetical protein